MATFYSLMVLTIYFAHAFGDLYNSSDPMAILTSKNFYETIFAVENAWIIEFYNSWCGHCKHFAPIWREFAKDIEDWDHTIKAAVLDCSDDENVPLCRDYEVMTYPSVRLFGQNLTKGNNGKDVRNRNALQEEIIHFISKEQESLNGSKSWITLLKYNGSLNNIFESAPKKAKYAAVVLEKPGSIVGAEVALDLGHYPMVYVRSMDTENGDVFNTSSLPAIIVLDRSGHQETLQEKPATREEVTAIIMKHFNLMSENTLYNTKRSTDMNLSIDKEEGAGDGKADDIFQYTKNAASSDVYMVDIENALSYALNHEVLLHKTIYGESLIALKRFLHSLQKYLPMRPKVSAFMSKFIEYVDRHKDIIYGEDIGTTIIYLNNQENTKLPDLQPWVGCKGSQPTYRGYTCGLWTLFHTLTINAVLEKGESPSYVLLDVLRGIHGYAKYFFSCENCSKNFQAMYKIDAESFVKQPNDEIIWLWKGHNKVNKRLKGDLTEDPEYVKQPFPPKSICNSCWTRANSFNENEVLKFLKKIYSKNSLSLKGVQNLDFIPNHQNKQAKVFQDKFLKDANSIGINSIKDLSNYNNDLSNVRNSSWSFNNTDFSLCVMLYVFSTIMILGCYSMFIIRRRLRRRKFIDKCNRSV